MGGLARAAHPVTMKVFLTGGTGWIGSGVVRELRAAHHEVTALVRTSSGADAVAALGASPRIGGLLDRDGLRAAASESDAAIHCAFDHRFAASDLFGAVLVRLTRRPYFALVYRAGRTDLRAIEALRAGLAASSSPYKVLLTTGPIAGLIAGRVGVETDPLHTSAFGGLRIASERATLEAARFGVRSASIRLPPSVHGHGDTGFVAQLAKVARASGVAAYLGTGENRWSAVHRDDAATLYRLAMEGLAAGTVAPGTVLHAVAETGVPFRELSTALGQALSVAASLDRRSTFPPSSGWSSA